MKPVSLAWLAVIPTILTAQTAPTAYTVTQVNSMLGPPVTMTIYRDGDKALIDNVRPDSRTRSLYNLATKTNQSWDATKPSAGCSESKFNGEWGDPYEFSNGLMTELNGKNPKQTGMETLNGFRTQVLEASDAQGSAKVWVDVQTGLIIKAQFSQPGKPATTLVEIKKVALGKPAASVFQLPSGCASAAPPSPTATANPDFVSAMIPGQKPSQQTCNVIIRILKAETYEPVTGLQVSVNLDVDLEGRRPQVLKQLTRPYRVDNAPTSFDVRVRFPDGGESSALIYRQCFSQRTVLLMILKNPARPTDGVEWQWAKSGKLSQ